ncbi:TrkH family potassium uptake protein [Methanoculleus taiwanensis]|uniref:TrkH family potassium uptake protein n=1 Tax=Methanoculleus taiwanensis TaxID=1550565 RepID=UPI000FFF5631|nr:TrkH family potassium uptake protein [Methanoculleus taiwanensis]
MHELVSPVNSRSILKYTGYLLLMIGAIIAVPVAAALILGEIVPAAIYAASSGVTLLAGGLLIRLLPECELHQKEAIVIAAIVFPLSSIINAVPLALVNNLPALDALFESVSGLTTTGLSVAPAGVSALFLFTRSWAQWVGGIGIAVLALSILVTPGTSAFRLFDANIGETRLRPNVAGTARVLGTVYAGITILTFILLLLAGMPIFDAVCQAFTTVSTGGFSTKPESIAGFSGGGIPIIIAFGCIMGAANFALYPKLFRAPRTALASIQLRYFILFLTLGTVGLAVTIPGAAPGIIVSEAAFQAISALTTAGFSTIDIGALPDTSKAVLTALMWIGGGVGSTAGGIKIVRIVILVQLVRIVFVRFFVPRETVIPLKIRDHIVDEQKLTYLFTFVLLYFAAVALSAFAVMLHGVPMVDAVFEVSSALGTVGLSSGITGAEMAGTLKAVLIADMLLGRIEIIPLLIFLMPSTWRRRPDRAAGTGAGKAPAAQIPIVR